LIERGEDAPRDRGDEPLGSLSVAMDPTPEYLEAVQVGKSIRMVACPIKEGSEFRKHFELNLPRWAPETRAIFVEGKLPKGTKVCVTGANGFLGSWIVCKLLEREYQVIGTVRDLANHAKLKHLHCLPGSSERLQLFEADLNVWGSFDSAIKGQEVDVVIHTASPYPSSAVPHSEQILLQTAAEGTLNVLATCSASPSVERVIITSSTAAIIGKDRKPGQCLSENDWSDEEWLRRRKAWYPLSKFLAEIGAWKFMKTHYPKPHFKLLALNPCLAVGPMLSKSLNASQDFLLKYLTGGKQLISPTSLSLVDVRDVAEAHIRCMEHEHADGRYMCVGSCLTESDLCAILREVAPTIDPGGIPTEMAEGVQDALPDYDTAKVQALGVSFRSVWDTLRDAVGSLRQKEYLARWEGPDSDQGRRVALGADSIRASVHERKVTIVHPMARPSADAKSIQVFNINDVSRTFATESELQDLFRTFNANDEGCISKAEFRRFYTSLDDWTPLENQGQVTEILKRHDMFGDGGLTFDQFAMLMLQVSKT